MTIKFRRATRHRICRTHAFSLLECLVYLAVLFIVLSVAYTVYYRTLDLLRIVARSSQDVAAAMQAGERWRADIRRATTPPRVEDHNNGQVLVITSSTGVTRYQFEAGVVSLQAGDQSGWVRLITGVRTSRMIPEPRGSIAAWRWELELQPRRKVPRMLPLFTFEAVPAQGLTQ